jgi:hypothetical protein
MIRERARSIIQYILRAASFEVEELEERGDLSAIRGDACIVVLCSDNAEEIEAFDRVRYQIALDEGALDCIKLLVTFNDAVTTENCIRWGRDEVAVYAGQAAIAAVADERFELDITALPTRERREVERGGPELPHLPIKISREQAGLISGKAGPIRCRFIPHWVYRYESSGEKEFYDRVISFDARGSGAISAINGLKSDMEIEKIEESGIPPDSEVLTPMIDKNEARERIIDDAIEELTQGVRVKQVSGDAILSEDRILKPDRRDIHVEMTLVYVPVWQVRGKKIVEVNAYSGDILQVPMDEGVELI